MVKKHQNAWARMNAWARCFEETKKIPLIRMEFISLTTPRAL